MAGRGRPGALPDRLRRRRPRAGRAGHAERRLPGRGGAGEGSWGALRRGGESPLWVEVGEIVFRSVVIGYATPFLLGIVALRTPLPVFLRTGLLQVVPLAFGAALANELLSGDQDEIREARVPRSLGVFALGAISFAAPIAPTSSVGAIGAQIGWERLGVLLLVTLVATT